LADLSNLTEPKPKIKLISFKIEYSFCVKTNCKRPDVVVINEPSPSENPINNFIHSGSILLKFLKLFKFLDLVKKD
jgi:hypothetical protein